MGNLSRRVAIFGNCHQVEKSDHAGTVVRLLREAGISVAVEREFLSFLRECTKQGASFQEVEAFDGYDCTADLAFSMGGDGTFLTVAEKFAIDVFPFWESTPAISDFWLRSPLPAWKRPSPK